MWDSSVTDIGNSSYVVKVRKLGDGETEWKSPPHNATPSSPCTTINLDEIITEPGGNKLGLADEPYAYQFQVQAVVSTSSETRRSQFSKFITIIDTPVTTANGHSPRGFFDLAAGKADVTWKSVNDPGGILNSEDYERIWYQLRYRQAIDHSHSNEPEHTLPGWQPDQFFAQKLDDDRTDSNSATINGLAKSHLYAIQLVIMQLNNQGSEPADDQVDVFAARDVYVWTSDEPADNGDRVASFPLIYRLTERTDAGHPEFEYRTCDETFDVDVPTRKRDWVALIRNAFDRGQAALPTDLVTITYSSEDCTDFRPLIAKIVLSLNAFIATETSMPTEDKKRAHVDSVLQMVRSTGVIRVHPGPDGLIEYDIDQTVRDDAYLSEIIMYNDNRGSLPSLSVHGIFNEVSKVIEYQGEFVSFSKIIGHEATCWFDASGIPTTNVAMCTRSTAVYRGSTLHSSTSDIFIRRSVFESSAESLAVPMIDARMNLCGVAGSAYWSFLHEVGHALGIGGG